MIRNLILLMLLLLFFRLDYRRKVSFRNGCLSIRSSPTVKSVIRWKWKDMSCRRTLLSCLIADTCIWMWYMVIPLSINNICVVAIPVLSIPVFMFLLLGRRMSIISVLTPASCETIHRGVSRWFLCRSGKGGEAERWGGWSVLLIYPEGGNLLVGHLQNVTIALKGAEGNSLSLPYLWEVRTILLVGAGRWREFLHSG